MQNVSAGQVFAGDYQIVRPLGRGGMGTVFLALQLSTGRQRALKMLQPHLVEDPRMRERFALEARAASNLQSDHVVEVVAAGIDAATGTPWLAMEYLEGETLDDRVHRLGRLGPAEVAEIARQLCHGLSLAHQAGLVHRDLKPANVFVANPRREGVPFTVKLLDFGIAKLTQVAHVHLRAHRLAGMDGAGAVRSAAGYGGDGHLGLRPGHVPLSGGELVLAVQGSGARAAARDHDQSPSARVGARAATRRGGAERV